jgi:hypothetical protein
LFVGADFSFIAKNDFLNKISDIFVRAPPMHASLPKHAAGETGVTAKTAADISAIFGFNAVTTWQPQQREKSKLKPYLTTTRRG